MEPSPATCPVEIVKAPVLLEVPEPVDVLDGAEPDPLVGVLTVCPCELVWIAELVTVGALAEVPALPQPVMAIVVATTSPVHAVA